MATVESQPQIVSEVEVNGRDYLIWQYAHFMYATKPGKKQRFVTVYKDGGASFKASSYTREELDDVIGLVRFMLEGWQKINTAVQ